MKIIIRIMQVLGSMVEDFFIALGLILISIATFEINEIAGIYVVGFICLILGVLIARKPKGGE